jgi:hypothetical protein
MQHPAAIPPALAVMAILDRFNRDELGHTIEVLIALLDIWDGDPDDQQTNDAEDDSAFTGIAKAYADSGPGCIASDSGDQAYVEWHTMRGNQKGGPNILAGHEDDEDDDPGEDDDPSGQSDEDGVNTGGAPRFGRGGPSGAGCPIADPDSAVDDRPCDAASEDGY